MQEKGESLREGARGVAGGAQTGRSAAGKSAQSGSTCSQLEQFECY